jgi:hypothetical protein
MSKCSLNVKLIDYIHFKKDYLPAKYVYCLDIKNNRSILANFRSSSHCLSIETGRYSCIERDYR